MTKSFISQFFFVKQIEGRGKNLVPTLNKRHHDFYNINYINSICNEYFIIEEIPSIYFSIQFKKRKKIPKVTLFHYSPQQYHWMIHLNYKLLEIFPIKTILFFQKKKKRKKKPLSTLSRVELKKKKKKGKH